MDFNKNINVFRTRFINPRPINPQVITVIVVPVKTKKLLEPKVELFVMGKEFFHKIINNAPFGKVSFPKFFDKCEDLKTKEPSKYQCFNIAYPSILNKMKKLGNNLLDKNATRVKVMSIPTILMALKDLDFHPKTLTYLEKWWMDYKFSPETIPILEMPNPTKVDECVMH